MGAPEVRGLQRAPGSYEELFGRISTLIEQGRKFVVRQVNTVLVATYWQTGCWIVEFEQQGKRRAEYGEALIKRLSGDLTRRFGKGWGTNLLIEIRQFYLTYRALEKTHTVCGFSGVSVMANSKEFDLRSFQEVFPLTWSHYRLLMRIQDVPKRAFYEAECRRGFWSVRQLDREINALLYERTSLSKRKDLVLAKANQDPLVLKPEDEIKDSYVLEFLGLKNEYSETDLEEALIQRMENFLLELGKGFAFVGRQIRFQLDGDEYRIDLLLYHIGLARYIVIELKVSKFTHAHTGQINFYLNWAKENIWPRAQNDPLGIIVCSDKNNTTVKYATGGLSNKIFVSKYLLQLPKPEELKRELEHGRDLFLQNEAARRLESRVLGRKTGP